MSLHATPAGEKTQKPIPPAGPQVAVCYSIIDIGTHSRSFQGQEAKPTPLVHFGWEFPNLPHQVFDPNKGPQPMAIFQEYTVSLGEKAKLGKLLTSWRGVPPQDLSKELPIFLGQPCLINVVHVKSKSNPNITYANIAMNGLGVMRLPQGTTVGQLTNTKTFFNLDTYSHDAFLKLPKWIQDKIQGSLDWSGIVAKFGPPPVQAQTQQQANAQFTQQSNQNAAFNQPQANNFNQTQVNSFNQPPQNNATFGGEAIKGNPFDGPAPF